MTISSHFSGLNRGVYSHGVDSGCSEDSCRAHPGRNEGCESAPVGELGEQEQSKGDRIMVMLGILFYLEIYF